MNTAENVAKILLDIHGITFNPTKPYTYASGIKSPVYTDCRLLMSYPKQRKEIIKYYVEAVNNSNIPIDIIAGTATAGIPHAAWIANELNLPMIYVRGAAKDHGKGNLIEGEIRKGQHAIVIEDLISTGGSSVACVQALRAVDLTVSHIFSIITYGMEKAIENFKTNNITLVSLTNFETVVQVAKELQYIKNEEQQMILDWTKDPNNWGRKMGFT